MWGLGGGIASSGPTKCTHVFLKPVQMVKFSLLTSASPIRLQTKLDITLVSNHYKIMEKHMLPKNSCQNRAVRLGIRKPAS